MNPRSRNGALLVAASALASMVTLKDPQTAGEQVVSLLPVVGVLTGLFWLATPGRWGESPGSHEGPLVPGIHVSALDEDLGATFQPSQFSYGDLAKKRGRRNPYGATDREVHQRPTEFDELVAKTEADEAERIAALPTDEELDEAKKKLLQSGGGLAVLAGLLLLGPFMITPWIVKQFKPEWSYGKRVATGFVVSFGVGALTGIARAASGGEKK